jgi:serine/threonine-protein kinase
LFKPEVELDSAILEAQLQRRLSQHPRIVTLRNLDIRTGPGPIVVTEFVPGGSVADQIGQGSAGLLNAIRWTLDSADGLAHAHANDIFHRDIKPSNLLLTGNGHASICDFGVAEDSFGTASNPVYTKLAAPELQGTGTTEQTEVWMLGVLLYRLLLGEYPFPEGAAGLPAGHQVRPQDKDPQIPAPLSRLLVRALSIDPAERHQTIDEFRTELLRVRAVTDCQPAVRPDALKAWEANLPNGQLAIVEVIRPTASTFAARLRVDKLAGAGPRSVEQRPRRSTEGLAVREAHSLLKGIVEGRLP